MPSLISEDQIERAMPKSLVPEVALLFGRKTSIKKSQNLNDRILGWWYFQKKAQSYDPISPVSRAHPIAVK
jgi:hypothetical protein